jgi:hypothetical protein
VPRQRLLDDVLLGVVHRHGRDVPRTSRRCGAQSEIVTRDQAAARHEDRALDGML